MERAIFSRPLSIDNYTVMNHGGLWTPPVHYCFLLFRKCRAGMCELFCFVACPCAFRDRCELAKLVALLACTHLLLTHSRQRSSAPPLHLAPVVVPCQIFQNFRRALRGASSGRRNNPASGSTTLSANRINSKDSITTGRQFLLSELSSSIARNRPHQQRFVYCLFDFVYSMQKQKSRISGLLNMEIMSLC